MVILYGSPLSQPTRMVMWTLSVLNVKYEFKRVDAGKGEQATPEFLKLNPNAVFPVLVEEGDGFALWESNAICRYLVAKHGNGSQLVPSNLQQEAEMNQWLDWKHAGLREGFAGVVRRQVMAKMVGKGHSMFKTFDEVKPEREVRLMLRSLEILEQQLTKASGGFVVPGTGRPTLADLAVFEEVEQLKLLPQTLPPPMGGDLTKQFPQITAWQERVRQTVPGFAEVHKELLGASKKLEEMRQKQQPKL
ncbi:hypothetical protein BASA81_006716 [Batrachochytrium salamandrivorans]|nr:hypothetical protein BASA81_006716 [Batrachochytrium salamandrivorans]